MGFAEADPTADVEGYDVMLKVVILANSLLGANLKPSDVLRCGITELSAEQIHGAVENGYIPTLDGTLRSKFEQWYPGMKSDTPLKLAA